MPSAAVSGAAIAESFTVVQNEFHAAPAQMHAVRSPFDAERLDVVPQRRRVVAAPGLDEAAGERHRVDDDRQQRPGQRDAVAEAPHAVGQRRRQARIALAGQRRVDLAAEHAPLHEERAEREQQQQDAERRRASLVELRADDREEDLGRQHAEVAAEHDRVAEVGDRLDEADQERVREARAASAAARRRRTCASDRRAASAPLPPATATRLRRRRSAPGTRSA